MHIVVLRFTELRAEAPRWLDGHKAWLQQGFDDGVFLMAGSLRAQQGGVVMAHQVDSKDLQQRVDADPFVMQGIVSAEILDIAPARTDDRMRFLLDGPALAAT